MKKICIPFIFACLCSFSGPLSTKPMPLEVDVSVIEASTGGTAHFSLDAGTANANRFFALFACASGTQPGTMLPGGSVILPINWDVVTQYFLVIFPHFLGSLNNSGKAVVTMTLPPNLPVTQDVTLSFAFALAGPPWDFASNPVDILIKAPGGINLDIHGNLLGWKNGGEMCWMHGYDAGSGGKVESIATVFGSAQYPGVSPPNGSPVTFYVWDDPTNDWDPSDAALLQAFRSTVQNVDTDILNYVSLPIPQAVNGVFFIGCCEPHASGEYVAPLDLNSPSQNSAWLAGADGGLFDPIGMGPVLIELASIGLPDCFMLHAK